VNLIAAGSRVIVEMISNYKFAQHVHRYSKITAIITILAAIDIEILAVLYSNVAGFAAFNAPVHWHVRMWVFYWGAVNIIIEDFPQLVIQACICHELPAFCSGTPVLTVDYLILYADHLPYEHGYERYYPPVDIDIGLGRAARKHCHAAP
jgi:hypothetical protein